MKGAATATFASAVLLLTAVSGNAQMPPPGPGPGPGFVPPFEIMRTLRSSGFEPLAPPLREGPTFVVRATDYRGVPMRVVIDARTGAIRDATQIVLGPPGAYGSNGYGPGPYGSRGDGPGPYGPGAYGPQMGMAGPAYGPPYDDRPPPYGPPPDFDAPDSPDEQGTLAPPSPPAPHAVPRASVAILPPLPRSRPADAAKPELTSRDVSVVKPDAKPVAASDPKPDATTDMTSTLPPAAPVPTKPGKAPVGPPIND